MKKTTKILFLFLLTFLCILPVNAKEKVNLYLFWGDGCPHCAMEKEYLETLEKEFPNLTIAKYEVWYNEENENFRSGYDSNHSEHVTVHTADRCQRQRDQSNAGKPQSGFAGWFEP